MVIIIIINGIDVLRYCLACRSLSMQVDLEATGRFV